MALYVREEIPVKKLDNDICKDLTKDVEILCVNQVKDKIEEKEDNTKESLEDMFK